MAHLAKTLLTIAAILLLGYFIVQLMEREQSAVYVDDKVRIAVLKDGCKTLVPYSFKFDAPGLYNIQGLGQVEVERVIESDLKQSKKPVVVVEDETGQEQVFLPDDMAVQEDKDGNIARQLYQAGVQIIRVPLDALQHPEKLERELKEIGHDISELPGTLKDFLYNKYNYISDKYDKYTDIYNLDSIHTIMY